MFFVGHLFRHLTASAPASAPPPALSLAPSKELVVMPGRTRRTYLQAAMLLVTGSLFLLATSTAAAVELSPACSVMVHRYVSRLQRNTVSKLTLLAWHNWGIGHPNWKPNPRLTRARFKRVRESVPARMLLSCENYMLPPSLELALLSPDLSEFMIPPVDTPAFDSSLAPPPQYLGTAFPQPLLSEAAYPPAGSPGFFGGGGGGAAGGSTGGIGTGGAPSRPSPIGNILSPSLPVPPNQPVTATPVFAGPEPVLPAPVPEPGTLLLTFTAFAAGATRLYSTRNHRRKAETV